MSIILRAAAKLFSVLPAGVSTRLMLSLSPALGLVSSRHRERFRVLARIAGPGRTIAYGTFAGMRYFRYAAGSQLLPKFAGTYELELRAVFDEIIALNPDVIADVGSAEGYYVVGLARRLPSATVFAYDVDRIANSLCARLAAANHVADRVRMSGLCSPATLESAIATAARPVVICDVEGAEDDLLRPDETPSLRRAHVMVELHDGQRPGVSGRIRARFEPTHNVHVVPDARRSDSDLPPGLDLTADERRLAMDEGRQSEQQWFFMTPKATR